MSYRLKFTLLSDATFGRGDGVAGVVDAEVQHDKYGFPFLGGKTLKGLLGAECAEILYALKQVGDPGYALWCQAAHHLFGDPGSVAADNGYLHVGNAELPADLRTRVASEIEDEQYEAVEILESLTTIRRQTAIDPTTGAPKKETLRAMRLIIRETPFEARLDFLRPPERHDLLLLSACVKAFRRAGTGRHRGRGKLEADLWSDEASVTEDLFRNFEKELKR